MFKKKPSINSNSREISCSKTSCTKCTGSGCTKCAKKPNFGVQSPLANMGCIEDTILELIGDSYPIVEDMGSGSSLVITGTAPTYELRGIAGTTGIGVSSDATDVIVSNTTTVANVGSGQSIVSDGAPPTYELKGLVAGGGISLSSNSTDITITALIASSYYDPFYQINSISGDVPVFSSTTHVNYSRINSNVVLHGAFLLTNVVNAGSRTIQFNAPIIPFGGLFTGPEAQGICAMSFNSSTQYMAVVIAIPATTRLGLTFTAPAGSSFTGYYSIQYSLN